MKTTDKILIIALVIVLLISAFLILSETPIQKATKEYIRQGDLTVYVYE